MYSIYDYMDEFNELQEELFVDEANWAMCCALEQDLNSTKGD